MRSNEEKSYLVLQHLYELFTEKDPTNVDPYKMERDIIGMLDTIAEGVADEFISRFEKVVDSDPNADALYEKLLKVFESMKRK